jgi:1-acyl-sn-glycerol-3-phosphate acyltransferase
MSGSYLATGFAIWKTLAITVPTLVDAARGRLTVDRADRRLTDWSTAILERSQVKLRVDGLEDVPRDRAYIVMSNHQSHLDIPIIFAAWHGSLRMVAKAELFRVPLWGRAMREAGFVSVDRSGDRANAEQAMREAGETIARGVSVWIAPEGTRSLDGRIAKFKKGGFLLAQTTGALIVPLSIDGSRNILPKHEKVIQTGVPVRLTFGRPIQAKGRPLDELKAEVRAAICAHVNEPAE